jgi:hypothetical protein
MVFFFAYFDLLESAMVKFRRWLQEVAAFIARSFNRSMSIENLAALRDCSDFVSRPSDGEEEAVHSQRRASCARKMQEK